MPNVIDLEKLENKAPQPDGSFICFCPACGEENRNLKSRNHLRVWPTLQFNCVVNTGDKQHNARILQLIGTESDGIVTYSAPREQKIEIEKSWPITILEKLIHDYSYFENRGISATTQQHFKLGVALSGSLNGRVCVPIFDEHKTKIIGFNARLINYSKWHKDNRVGKWKILGNKKSFIFCGDESFIRESRTILITEGPADILALYEAGIKNSLCLFGTIISSKQLAFLIKNNPKKIVIGLNNEESGVGNKAALKLKDTLNKYFDEDKVVIGLPEGEKDFNDLLIRDKNLLASYREKWLS
jgi:hypothetical protein